MIDEWIYCTLVARIETRQQPHKQSLEETDEAHPLKKMNGSLIGNAATIAVTATGARSDGGGDRYGSPEFHPYEEFLKE